MFTDAPRKFDHSFDHKYGGFARIFEDNSGQKQANAGCSGSGQFEHEKGRWRVPWTPLDVPLLVAVFRVRVPSSAPSDSADELDLQADLKGSPGAVGCVGGDAEPLRQG